MTEQFYKVIYETRTNGYHLQVVEDRSIRPERVLLIDGVRHSAMYLDETDETSFEYPYYFHLGLLFREVKNVLFIGGGGLSGPKKFLKEYPEVKVDVAEIDPVVIDVARRYFSLPDDPRLMIYNMDGRRYLEETGRRYDLMVLDAYNGKNIPLQLLTVEFFRLAYSRLNQDGSLVFNLISAVIGQDSETFRRGYKTLKEVFGNVYVFPVANTLTFASNIILVASDRKLYRNDMVRLSKQLGRKAIDFPKYIDRMLEYEVDTAQYPVFTDSGV